MSLAERWQLAGVDLDTRRRRVLEELALKGRTGEQARLREELADAVRAFQQTEDLSRLERVVEGWYRHALMLRYAPGWADKLDRLRRGERPAAGQQGRSPWRRRSRTSGCPTPGERPTLPGRLRERPRPADRLPRRP
jgi:hypothetical protein